MDRTQKELIARLFVFATELLEDTHAIAVRGQSPKRKPKSLADSAKALQELAHRLDSIAVVIQALAGEGTC